MNNQNNRAQVIQFLNNNNNQELTNAINDFNQGNNERGINDHVVNSIIEYCTLNNVANINNETLTVHTPTYR